MFGKTKLFQLGRLYCMPGAVIKEHVHLDWYELTIVTDGKGLVTTNGRSVEVKKGDIYFSFPGDFHKITSSETAPLKYDFFSFASIDADIDGAFRKISSERSRFDQRLLSDDKIGDLVSLAIAEFFESDAYRERVLELVLEEIILFLLRACRLEKKEAFQKHPRSTEELCYQIMYLIDSRLYSVSNLSFLGEELGYNYAYLSKIFRQTTGTTISDYYQNRRLTAAKLLIEEGRVSFSRIAQMLNFSSLYAFSKAFKNRFGYAPKSYRETVTGEQSPKSI